MKSGVVRIGKFMVFHKALDKYSGNIAFISEDSSPITYQEFLKTADTIAKHIKQRCLTLVVCKNNLESVAGYVGLMRADAVQILVNDSIDDQFFSNLLTTYRPEYIYLPKEKFSLSVEVSLVWSNRSYVLLRTSYYIDYTLHDDLALLLSTSGSTGSPKLVRQSYKNIFSNAEAISEYLEIDNCERAITTMPMGYTYGLSIINSHLLTSASIVLTEATLMDKRFWQILKDKRPTNFGGVPYIYEMLKRLRFERMDLPSLNFMTQAGGKLSAELSSEFAEICEKKGIRFYVMYGQTEATARMSYLPWTHARSKAGSIGVPIPGGEFHIEDENGNVIDKSEVSGELVYRGDNVTLGYAKNRFDLGKGDENKGMLYTGDIAKQDRDGFFYIVGRKKRFLKMFGNRINLDEVEALIKATGCDCACKGTDENLNIYITQRGKEAQIKQYIVERTHIHRSAFTVVAIDEIPRNESGKILYSALK